MAPAIELTDLGRAYGERTALSGVTLTLERGRTLAVFGSNGAGKTTLLRILATLLRPHAGRVRVLGRDLPGDGWAVRGRVGLLAHDPLLYRELSARENLRFHARLHGVAEARVEALLDQVGLRRRADEPVRTLSRGMAQRVAICRASAWRSGGSSPARPCTTPTCSCRSSRSPTSTRARRRRSTRSSAVTPA